jgi:hypothetical protein
VRFPLFRLAMQVDLNDSMVFNIDRNLEVWHRIDARPPQDGADPPPFAEIPATDDIVTYERRLPLIGSHRFTRKGYRIHRVLDLGVGHEHWHEQRCRIYGGEMDSLDGPGLHVGPLTALHGRDVYRLFNGPVEDQGGFIDGTVNYYVLAQFVPEKDLQNRSTPPRNAFAILWLDEQAVLSERWRLVHPDDSGFGGFRDVIPSAVVQYMDKDFRHFRFDRSRFWDPMRDGRISPDSRMAVSRQVIVLSGHDPRSGEAQLYTINSSFGTSDRTWRWRAFPPKTGLASPFDLREDMTLFVRGDAGSTARCWFQRYLPASGRMKPDGADLRLQGPDRPPRGIDIPAPEEHFDHPWQWLPQDVFDYVHAHFSHFGCYETRVNWRWQYYRLELKHDKDARLRGEETPWTERGSTLIIRKASLDWTLVNAAVRGEPAAIAVVGAQRWGEIVAAVTRLVSGELTQDELTDLLVALQGTQLVRQIHDRGLFQPEFVVKLLYREPLGWILVHWDKRDDDLLPFRDMTTTGGAPFDLEVVPGLPPPAAGVPALPLRVVSYHQVVDPPAVESARVILTLEGERARLRVELRPARGGPSIDENIWRIKLGALRRNAAGNLIGAERLLDEIRVNAPVQDTPRPDWCGFEWPVEGGSAAQLERLRECCSEQGRQRFGTSLWLENVVGHVAPPDWVEFDQTRLA